MARAIIPVHAIPTIDEFTPAGLITAMFTAINATDGAEVLMHNPDHKMLLVMQNNSSVEKSVTIKAGNGLQGVKDITAPIAAGKYVTVVVESGRFKHVSGEDKGKILLTGNSSDIKVAAFRLP